MSSALNGKPGIAVMMYTVLAQARADLEGTLARLAAAGYTGIETYGLVEEFGPARVRAAISAAGLTLTSAHAPFPAGSRAEAILDENEDPGDQPGRGAGQRGRRTRREPRHVHCLPQPLR